MIPIIARFRELPATAFFILAALTLPAGASTVTIDMRSSTTYLSWFGGWGSIGQTFIAPSELMFDVSMWTSRWSGGTGNVSFLATLRAWNGSAPVGDALFTSAVQQATETTATEFHFDFGSGIPLTVGESYVFYYSTQSGGLINSHTTDPDYQSTYADGRSVAGYSPGSLPTNESTPIDNVFVANFQGAAVPEPSSLLLLGSSFLALARRARRRQ